MTYQKWVPAGKGLTSWLSFVVSSVSLSLSHWYPGSGVVLDCIDSWSLHLYLFWSLKAILEIMFLSNWPSLKCYHWTLYTGLRRAVGNMSGYRCVSDCRSRGREFDPGPVPYFRGDWSWNNFYGHSPPFRWFIQEGLLSVTSESMCTNYWLIACSSLPRKKCG